jgi:2,3-bisphosphoglycerate-independent phosphoglycerate mutase
MKLGYVLLDGCGDRPTPSLNFTTPLQSANTPNLDAMARRSKMGTVVTVGEGIAPESDIAVFNMLGYSFAGGYPGRGVIESIGAGIDFKDGELALRANFATSRDGLIADRRAGRDLTDKEAKALQDVVNEVKLDDAVFEFRSTVGYRGVVVIRWKKALSAEVSNTDPAYVRTKGFGAAKEVKRVEKVQRCLPLDKTPAAKKASELVNEFLSKASSALEGADVNASRTEEGKKPANFLLLRDAGDHLPVVTPFREKYGMKGVALVEMPAEIGIARLLGMKEVRLSDHRDLANKAKMFNAELAEGTAVYAHIKGPDEFGHDGDAAGKKKNIETIDDAFFGAVSDKARGATLAVSCDHSTPCVLKMHSSDPVPLLVTTESRDTDCCRFTEDDAARGSLGRLRGDEVLSTALSLSRP